VTVPDPVGEFRAVVEPEGAGPVFYLFAALLALDGLGWLAHQPTDHETTMRDPEQPGLRAALDALYGADGQALSGAGFDLEAARPHVTLWVLRLNRYLKPVDGLDHQLHDWRTAAEDAAGEPFHWLPFFPEHAP
jgi:hypothetical protein